MANNLKYSRKFIILKKEYSNMRNLNPKGHGKIELRGPRLNISLNIENGEKNTYYNVILLSGIKKYELGKIYLEDRTRGKGEFTLNYKDLESLGFSLDKINAILILRDDKVLLGNYINKNDGSIERYLNDNIEINNLEEEVVEEVVEEEFKQGEEAKEIEKVEETEKVEEIYEIEEDIKLEEKEEISEKKDVETVKEEETPKENKPIEDEITELEYEKAITTVFEPNHSRLNVDIENKIDKVEKRDQTTDYILNILSFFPYAEPFKIDLKGYNWWRIDIDNPLEEKGFLPYFRYITGGNQKYPIIRDAIHASELMKIHKHYIFGLYNESKKVKFYVYGVPGKFTSKEHPGRGLTGFGTWFEGKDGEGYWLLYIDPSTGRIIYPINPMIPKD